LQDGFGFQQHGFSIPVELKEKRCVEQLEIAKRDQDTKEHGFFLSPLGLIGIPETMKTTTRRRRTEEESL
jgi:uncharacterized protein YcgL (UPF0745 family)